MPYNFLNMLNSLEMTGRSRTHIDAAVEFGCLLHPAAYQALREMRAAALAAGIELSVVSAFRDFERQLLIWNAKFRGERPLLDRNGIELRRDSLDDSQAIDAILCWSALPGASRHHWGSDFDVIDRRRIPEGYSVALVPGEFAAGGIFAPLDRWLETHMRDFGFFRPYRIDRGGVRPEAWHLSFAPVAVPTLQDLTLEILREALQEAAIDGRELLLERLPEIYYRYVQGVDSP